MNTPQATAPDSNRWSASSATAHGFIRLRVPERVHEHVQHAGAVARERVPRLHVRGVVGEEPDEHGNERLVSYLAMPRAVARRTFARSSPASRMRRWRTGAEAAPASTRASAMRSPESSCSVNASIAPSEARLLPLRAELSQTPARQAGDSLNDAPRALPRPARGPFGSL